MQKSEVCSEGGPVSPRRRSLELAEVLAREAGDEAADDEGE